MGSQLEEAGVLEPQDLVVESPLRPGVAREALNQGYAIADRIHNSGQAIVWSGPQETAEHYWQQFEGTGLTMTPLERA